MSEKQSKKHNGEMGFDTVSNNLKEDKFLLEEQRNKTEEIKLSALDYLFASVNYFREHEIRSELELKTFNMLMEGRKKISIYKHKKPKTVLKKNKLKKKYKLEDREINEDLNAIRGCSKDKTTDH